MKKNEEEVHSHLCGLYVRSDDDAECKYHDKWGEL